MPKSLTIWVLMLACHVAAPARAAEAFECTLIVDATSGETIRHDGECDRRAPPASSFKLPLAVMGFDAGVLTGEHAPVWPYKAAYDAPKRDHKNVDPTIWERDSVLWYSRELTRRLGSERFAAYVADFGYGNADVRGTEGKNDGLTHSWLSSSLQISPEEQVDFVRRLLSRRLSVSPQATALTLAVIPKFAAKGGWSVQGKTGSIWLRKPNGTFDRKLAVGWFVGWADKGGRRLAFARLSVGKITKGNAGPQERELFLEKFPQWIAE